MTRIYGLSCPVARALDLVGDRWTLLIIRDLLLSESCRFQEMQVSLSGITPGVLSARLKFLEEAGIVGRRFYSSHPPRPEYFLTDEGRALGPAVKALRTFGTKFPLPKQV